MSSDHVVIRLTFFIKSCSESDSAYHDNMFTWRKIIYIQYYFQFFYLIYIRNIIKKRKLWHIVVVYFLPKRVDSLSLSLSLLNILLTITKNLLVNIIMQVKIVSWKFVVNHQLGTWHIYGILLYFRVLTSFLANLFRNSDLLMLCGDTELNSGPMSNSSHYFQFVTGALTAANNFSKISLWKACNAIYIPTT